MEVVAVCVHSDCWVGAFAVGDMVALPAPVWSRKEAVGAATGVCYVLVQIAEVLSFVGGSSFRQAEGCIDYT